MQIPRSRRGVTLNLDDFNNFLLRKWRSTIANEKLQWGKFIIQFYQLPKQIQLELCSQFPQKEILLECLTGDFSIIALFYGHYLRPFPMFYSFLSTTRDSIVSHVYSMINNPPLYKDDSKSWNLTSNKMFSVKSFHCFITDDELCCRM